MPAAPPSSEPSAGAPSGPPARRGLGRKLALAVAASVVAVVLAEVGLRVVQRLRGHPYDAARVEQRLEALRASLSDGVPQTSDAGQDAAAQKPRAKARSASQDLLHPYIGYDHSHFSAQLEEEFAYFRTERSKEVFDVFVFGGSVAGGFAVVANESFRKRLADDPRLGGRPVRVWVEGRAAQKEPQQTALLAYLLCCGAEPDAVIALDGFNEVAVGLQNVRAEISHLYPYLPAWLARAGGTERNRAVLELALDLQERKRTALAKVERMLDWRAARFALSGEFGLASMERSARAVTDGFLVLQERLGADNGTDQLAPPPLAGTDEQHVDRCVRTWVAGARSLAGACRIRGITFLEVLQPTLHDTGSKPLDAREIERGTAIEAWTTGVHLGYPKLRAAGAELASSGVAFLDASMVFRAETQPLYIDACHFNKAGYELLAAAMAPALLDALERDEAARK
ncbi:MAG: hypothetical protein IT453_02500 [Planctomycetes bacterium]|nr:hypothetical protein [Planctomycetota bacterium]